MRRLLNRARPPACAAAAGAACGLIGSPASPAFPDRVRFARCAVRQDSTSSRAQPDRLSSFGLDDIPSSAYKAHFSEVHDAAAAQSAANVARRRGSAKPEAGRDESKAEREVRMTVARHLMQKLGYTSEELAFLGDDVLRMQGVRSPFRMARLCKGEVVVDLGSGFGPDAFLAAEKVGTHGRVTGINLSAAEVQQATQRAAERGLTEELCCFKEADMEATPLDSAAADVVISNGGFCLCPNKLAAFKEVYRILRHGGRIAISCTVLRGPLPKMEGKRWPPCMEVFMQRGDVEDLLGNLGFSSVRLEEKDARMDVWDLGSSDLDTVAHTLETGGASAAGVAATGRPAGMCSHARKAAERRAREEVETYLSRDREAGIHWGNPQFEHIKEFDMSELCARVVIYAEKI